MSLCSIAYQELYQYKRNKMNHITNDLMDRMERNIKKKIYKEMLDEQVMMKKINQAEQFNYRYQHRDRVKTEPFQYSYNKYDTPTKHQTAPPRENIYPPLKQQSVFLPIVEKARKQTSHNQSYYEDYPTSHSVRKEAFFKRNSYANNSRVSNSYKEPDYEIDSDEEKANKYLSQCQKIISSLRQITQKHHKKTPKKVERHRYRDVNTPPKQSHPKNLFLPKSNEDTSSQYKISITPVNSSNAKQQKQILRISVPHQKKINNNDNEINVFNSKFKQSKLFKDNSYLENEFVNSEFDEPKINKFRQKNKTLSPQKQFQEIKEEKKQIKNPVKSRANKKQQNNKKQEESKIMKKNQVQEDPEVDEQKKQKAILKYLKKAKFRGKQLFQKIQDFKKQRSNVEQEENEENANNVNKNNME